MSYLTANGLALPVSADSLKVRNIEIGARERSFSGQMMADVRARKRIFEAKLVHTDADTLALIRRIAIGDFDTLGLNGSFLSGKGLAPTSGGAGMYEPSVAADGTPMDSNALASKASPYTKRSGGNVWCNAGATNVLAANQRDCEDGTTGFTAYGAATVTQSAERFWQGSKSIKVVCSAANQGVDITYVAGSTTTYSGCIYATGNVAVILQLRNGSAHAGRQNTVTLDPGKWTMLDACSLAMTATTTYRLRVVAQAAGTFYVDGASIYVGYRIEPWGDPTPSAWSPPVYDFTKLARGEFSIFGFRQTPYDASGTYSFGVLELNTYASADNAIKIINSGSGRTLALYEKTRGVEQSATGGSYPTVEVWKPFCLSVARKNRTGVANVSLYEDDALIASMSPDPFFDPDLLTTLKLGHAGGGFMLDGLIIIPQALTLAQYRLIRDAATAYKWPDAPYVRLSGDAVLGAQKVDDENAAYMTALGRMDDEQQQAGRVSGIWLNNQATADVTFEER